MTMRTSVRVLALLGVLGAVVLTGGATATAAPTAASSVTTYWGMNEGPGARTMRDSASHHLTGNVGSEVQTGTVFNGSTGYTFSYLRPNTPPAHPQHLVTVPDNALLDPGSGYYSIQIRYRTTNDFGNLVQKGQSTTPGGQFKIQLPGGRPQCYFKGSDGKDGVGYRTPINDGHFHTLKCIKYANGVQLDVDGHRVGYKHGPMGDIENGYPVSIGGKVYCDQQNISCDYFVGQVDSATITKD